jgi:hypothetical protein
MTPTDEARQWRSSPQRVSPGTVTTGTHAAIPPRNRCVGAATEGSRSTGDRCTLGTPDDRQAASRVSGAAVHVRTLSPAVPRRAAHARAAHRPCRQVRAIASQIAVVSRAPTTTASAQWPIHSDRPSRLPS